MLPRQHPPQELSCQLAKLSDGTPSHTFYAFNPYFPIDLRLKIEKFYADFLYSVLVLVCFVRLKLCDPQCVGCGESLIEGIHH